MHRTIQKLCGVTVTFDVLIERQKNLPTLHLYFGLVLNNLRGGFKIHLSYAAYIVYKWLVDVIDAFAFMVLRGRH